MFEMENKNRMEIHPVSVDSIEFIMIVLVEIYLWRSI